MTAESKTNTWTGGILSLVMFTGMAIVFSACTSPTPPPPPAVDTTSHEFIWHLDTVGARGGLWDIAIIDENNIWAVGDVYLRDSSGALDPDPYGLAKWNWTSWKLELVAYHGFGSSTLHPGPLFTIRAFGENDVYVCSSTNLLWWNGVTWTEKAFFMQNLSFTGQVRKMWGANGSDLYCVGRSGALYRFTGTTWTSIASGTDVDFKDIWGSTSGTRTEILVLASNGASFPLGKGLVRVEGSNTTVMPTDSLSDVLSSIWFWPNGKYFIAGSGFYSTQSLSTPWIRNPMQSIFYMDCVRGTGTNDIVVVGSKMVSHYNGSTWRQFTSPEIPTFYGSYIGLAVKDNRVTAVGTADDVPIVLTGIRLPP